MRVSTWRVRKGCGWWRLESRDPQAVEAGVRSWGYRKMQCLKHCNRNKVGNTSKSAPLQGLKKNGVRLRRQKEGNKAVL